MRGKWNPKTRRYEVPRQQKIDDRPHNTIYAEELGVKGIDLWKNILENNNLERVSNCKTYHDYTMLKQTLVEEKGTMGKLKEFVNIFQNGLKY